MLARIARAAPFTRFLTPDPLVPSIESAEKAPEELLHKPRRSQGSFTWVPPEQRAHYVVRWISPAALQDLSLPTEEAENETFRRIISGEHIYVDENALIYPWAQNYAGFQFGAWAGQLGDGRVVTLFSVNGQEIQLKGAGRTAYSRFADGKAVVRSCVREALVSEALHVLGIPTTRVLALTELPGTFARRERTETCAVTTRFAPSWIRIGTFNLHHARGDRAELRRLADFCIQELGIGSGPTEAGGNRYYSLLKEVAVRNARMIAQCQAYGFLNGVLNTDNTSVLGLSMDYGPFAFMDAFSRDFTPNHDDAMLRYGFRNTPHMIWWNIVRLAEALGELIGAPDVDSAAFIEHGTPVPERPVVVQRLQARLKLVSEAYHRTYEEEYMKLMARRLGITPEGDILAVKPIVESALDMLEETEVDYNQFLRRLSTYEKGKEHDIASASLPKYRSLAPALSVDEAEQRIADWLVRVYTPHMSQSPDRKPTMDNVNPHFVLKNWVLADVIDRITRTGDWEAFDYVQRMALKPFAAEWGPLPDYVQAYLGDVPPEQRGTTCSCSS